MPIFEFQCRQCQNIFEELVMSKDQSAIVCPKCKSRQTEKLISRTGQVRSSAAPDLGNSCGPGPSTGFS